LAIEPRSRADTGRLDEALRRLVADEAITRDKQGCGEGLRRKETTMRWRSLVGVLVLASVLAACAHQPPPTGGAPLPGLLLGLVHGYISLFSLIASLFFPVRIYEFPNNGFFYDVASSSACSPSTAADARPTSTPRRAGASETATEAHSSSSPHCLPRLGIS